MITRLASVVIFVAIIFTGLLENVSSEESWKIYHLQPGGKADNESYLLLSRLQDAMNADIINKDGNVTSFENKLWTTKVFSLCLWFNIDTFTMNPMIFSYAISDEKSNEFTVAFFGDQIYVTLFGQNPDLIFRPTINWWHHLCVVWKYYEEEAKPNDDKPNYHIYIDGVERANDTGAVGPLYLNGTLVLGQDQDSLGGGFVRNSAFLGQITQMNMWNHALNPQEIKQLSDCNNPYHEPLLNWETINWNITGNIKERNGNPCQEKKHIHKILIPSVQSLNTSKQFCDTIDMKLVVSRSPEDDEHNRLIIQKAPSRCISEFFELPTAHLGVRYETERENWKDVNTDENVTYLGFVTKQNLNWETWDHAMLIANINYWQQIPSYLHSCALCEGHLSRIPLFLRGLCKDEKAEPNNYMIFHARNDTNNVLSLDGVHGLRIFLKKEKWVLYDEISNTTISEHGGSAFPLGTHNWKIIDTSKVCKFPIKSHVLPSAPKKKSKMFRLSLSACDKNEFPCSNDGTCINITKRCSIQPECTDFSDEENCDLMLKWDRYMQDMQPPELPLNITCSIDISKVIAIEITKQVIQVNFNVRLQWHDQRLRYKNLRDSHHQNRFNEEELDSIWVPNVQVFNEQKLLFSVEPTKVASVKRTGDSKRLNNDLIYLGEANPIIYKLSYSKNLDCPMNMVLFPFDHQHCTIYINLTNVAPGKDNVKFTFINNSTILDYQVLGDYTITNRTMEYKENNLHLTFHLLNQPTYHLFALYMPTILLHMIGYGTFAISADDFQDRATISLTILLVYMSLYSDVLTTLPQTSYLKCIDIWFIFSIFYLSSIIAVHLITNDTKDNYVLGKKVNDAKVLQWGKIFFGIIYILFQIVHWSYIFIYASF